MANGLSRVCDNSCPIHYTSICNHSHHSLSEIDVWLIFAKQEKASDDSGSSNSDSGNSKDQTSDDIKSLTNDKDGALVTVLKTP